MSQLDMLPITEYRITNIVTK